MSRLATSTPLTRRRFLRQATLAGLAPVAAHPLLAQAADADALVKTSLGTLRGLRNNGVRTFRAIPFAQPPVGNLRFRPAQAAAPWSGIRDATHFASAALQPGDRNVAQSEDCLYLNIWTPETSPGAPPTNLPVFVWIHGGGFTGGDAFTDGSVFAREGIVTVTLAYRLGVLGFLDLGPLLGSSYAGSANNALTDLLTALRWIKANIGAFGGDPTRVTIGGESAGAKLTDLLTGIPSARPLFHGMISESGGAERIYPKANSEAVAEAFGKLWTDTTHQPVTALRTAPARQLVDLQTEFLKTWPQHFPLRCELDGALFPELPLTTIAGGSARGKRFLIGTNREESAMFLGTHPQHDPTAADLGNLSLPEFNRILAQYAAVFPNMAPDQRRVRATTAEEYWVPSVHVANAAALGGAHVWAYELTLPRTSGPYKGVSPHTEDLPLVWNNNNGDFAPGTPEASLAPQVHAAWVSFLRGGPPAAPNLPTWPEYNPAQRPTMMLDVPSRVEIQPQQVELDLWKQFTK